MMLDRDPGEESGLKNDDVLSKNDDLLLKSDNSLSKNDDVLMKMQRNSAHPALGRFNFILTLINLRTMMDVSLTKMMYLY